MSFHTVEEDPFISDARFREYESELLRQMSLIAGYCDSDGGVHEPSDFHLNKTLMDTILGRYGERVCRHYPCENTVDGLEFRKLKMFAVALEKLYSIFGLEQQGDSK